ncbi:Flp pilus assembly protein TadD [Oxalobacteraceae bacterium GrIS 2.11]
MMDTEDLPRTDWLESRQNGHESGRGSRAAGSKQAYPQIDEAYAEVARQNDQLQALLSQTNIQDAVTLARLMIEQHPAQGFARHVLGAILLNQGQIGDAIVHLVIAAHLQPHNAEALNNLGCALQRSKRFEQAEQSYQSALKIKPDFVLAQQNLNALRDNPDRRPPGATIPKHWWR